MHSNRKGKSGSTQPNRDTSWVEIDAEEPRVHCPVVESGQVLKRDHYGIPDAKLVTNKKIRDHGLAPNFGGHAQPHR